MKIEVTYREPLEKDIKDKMEKEDKSYYIAREELRESYNGKPPLGYERWGDFWKSY